MSKKDEALKLALENICAAKLCEFNSMSSRHEMIRLMDAAITAIREAMAEQPAQQHTYASTQATMCAGCGEHKHTPLRIDAMGGYVCLTCIDKKLGSLLGEFGYPQPAQQEPVAYMDVSEKGQMSDLRFWSEPNNRHQVPLYTSPPASKPWVGLTQKDIDIAFDDTQEGGGFDEFARAIEAKLKERNA